jgi:hypothetical protein
MGVLPARTLCAGHFRSGDVTHAREMSAAASASIVLPEPAEAALVPSSLRMGQ